jgi:hypothetical protein
METIVYRKTNARVGTRDLRASDKAYDTPADGTLASVGDKTPFSPELFYPLVTDQEMITWIHWLPTSLVYDRVHTLAPGEVALMLRQLKAPAEVLEEFHWAWKMDLFESYEVRTPVRRDARDPLLLGRVGGQQYRIALWGESLLPLEEITALVHKSLALKARTASWHRWLPVAGALFGLILAVGVGQLAGEESSAAMICTLMFLGFFFAWLPRLLYTPENRQHDFLDRYRC